MENNNAGVGFNSSEQTLVGIDSTSSYNNFLAQKCKEMIDSLGRISVNEEQLNDYQGNIISQSMAATAFNSAPLEINSIQPTDRTSAIHLAQPPFKEN